jgi:hypothetical protein
MQNKILVKTLVKHGRQYDMVEGRKEGSDINEDLCPSAGYARSVQ